MRSHKRSRTLVGTFTAALLMALLIGLVATAAFAIDEIPVPPPPQPVQLALGMVGLAHLQTARLNVVMIGGNPDPSNRCRAELSFFDAAGRLFRDASGVPIAAVFILDPGKAARLDLREADAFRGRTGLRVAFRARMQALDLPPTTGPDPCRRVVATLEVFDNFTGRTNLLAIGGGNPDPSDLPFGMVGLARLQTARLNIVAIGGGQPDPSNLPACPVEVSFVNASGDPFRDASGTPIKALIALDPGQAGALDVRSADAFRGLTSMRVAFRPVLRVVFPPSPCEPPVATLEVFDNFTGRTSLLAIGGGTPDPGQ